MRTCGHERGTHPGQSCESACALQFLLDCHTVLLLLKDICTRACDAKMNKAGLCPQGHRLCGEGVGV